MIRPPTSIELNGTRRQRPRRAQSRRQHLDASVAAAALPVVAAKVRCRELRSTPAPSNAASATYATCCSTSSCASSHSAAGRVNTRVQCTSKPSPVRLAFGRFVVPWQLCCPASANRRRRTFDPRSGSDQECGGNLLAAGALRRDRLRMAELRHGPTGEIPILPARFRWLGPLIRRQVSSS